MSTFQALGLNTDLINAINDLGFTQPSEVQQKAIPVLLEEERDLVALAQTGTGKTAAFGFPNKASPSSIARRAWELYFLKHHQKFFGPILRFYTKNSPRNS